MVTVGSRPSFFGVTTGARIFISVATRLLPDRKFLRKRENQLNETRFEISSYDRKIFGGYETDPITIPIHCDLGRTYTKMHLQVLARSCFYKRLARTHKLLPLACSYQVHLHEWINILLSEYLFFK